MAIKLSPLTLSKRIPIWVISSTYISSVSWANSLENLHEVNQNQPNSQDFELNIRFLRNKLVPDNLIRVLDNTDDPSSAVKIFKWASLQTRFRHTPETYSRIILKLGLAGNVEEMEGFCQNMVREKIQGTNEALLSLIDVFVNHCRLSEAVKILVIMNSVGCCPSLGIINTLMSALVREKREFGDVLLVYKEMVKAGILPSVETLNCLVDALFKANRAKTALDQFRRMKKKGCSPDSRTFEILIKGLIASDRVDEAVGVLGEMFESDCQPDSSFFSSVIPLFCRANKPNEGIRLLRTMKESNFELDSFSCMALIECFCENCLLKETISLVSDMIKMGSVLPENVVVNVVNMFCELGKFDEALKFLEEKHIVEASPHNALLEGCYRSGKFSTAIDVLRRMCERNIEDHNSWNIIIQWVCEQQGIRKASDILGRMIVSGLTPDFATYSALVVGNCESRKYEDALKLFHRMKANRWVLDSISYSKLVEHLCCVGLSSEAAQVFRYMSQNESALQLSSLDMLIKGLCDTGNLSDAIKLYHSRTSWTSSTYAMIMHSLLRNGRLKDVLILYAQILVVGRDLDLESYCILIESMSLQNRVNNCVLLFNAMVNEGLVPVSERLFRMLSLISDHRRLCDISCSISKLVSRGVMDSSMYNVLINGLWKEGKENEARWLLDVMLEKGWVPDAKTHGLLIGSIGSERIDSKGSDYGNCDQDSISDILVDGLDF